MATSPWEHLLDESGPIQTSSTRQCPTMPVSIASLPLVVPSWHPWTWKLLQASLPRDRPKLPPWPELQSWGELYPNPRPPISLLELPQFGLRRQPTTLREQFASLVWSFHWSYAPKHSTIAHCLRPQAASFAQFWRHDFRSRGAVQAVEGLATALPSENLGEPQG